MYASGAMGLSDGDKVITTPFSFVASTNCLLYERARPVFVDIDPDTWNMDPDATAAAVDTETKAILAVEVFGNPVYFDRYEQIAADNSIPLIEDSCEALGATLDGRPAGNFGHAGFFAFYPNKQITTGEGGMIVTDNEAFRDMCIALRNQGRHPSDSWLQHTYLGYNYRISELTAALGLAQIKRLDEMLQKRRAVASLYDSALAPLAEKGLLCLPPMHDRAAASWFVYVVRLADEFTSTDRDAVMAHLRQASIGCNSYFPPIHLQPYIMEMLGTKAGDFPVTEQIAERTIALPFSAVHTESQIARVAGELTSALDSIGKAG